jgi:hypothetical protein
VRNRDQVDTVRHEAISNEGDAVEDDVLAQQVELDCSIGVAVQDEAPPVPTLRHMVWYVNGNHTSESSHARKRYQESFRRTAASAKVKMCSCCAGDASAKTSKKVVAGSLLGMVWAGPHRRTAVASRDRNQ